MAEKDYFECFTERVHQMKTTGFCKDATHYQLLEQQPIEIMQVLLSREQLLGFLKGNVIKYALRKKDDPIKDMQKVCQYSEWYVDVCEGRKINPRKEN